MNRRLSKKPLIYSEINDLLDEYGESVLQAAQNPVFRQRVTQETLDLFSPTSVSAFTLETTRAILESFEKGAIAIQDIYLLRDFMVEWQQRLADEESNLTLHESIRFILESGNVGESISEAAQKLLEQCKVVESAVTNYK